MATTKVSGELVDLNESTSESGLKMPSGTESNRPTPVAGQIRNNTNETSEGSSSCMEYYKSGAWQKINNVTVPPVGSENFNTVIYSGNSSTQNITGVGFQPDWVWIKERGPLAEQSNLYDSTRGVQKFIVSNSSAAEVTGSANRLNAFGSDGFTVGSDNEINDSGSTYVAWCWKANGGTTSSNGDGSITTTVQANVDAGFSVITYTGDGASTSTIGHGLGVAPKFVVIKTLSDTADWPVYSSATTDASYRLVLNSSNAQDTSNNPWNSSAPTSTVINLGSSGNVNINARTFVCYALAEITGYSKFGSYSGTGSSNPITGLGFQPAWVMIKSITSTEDWAIFDESRGANAFLTANTNSAEQSFSGFSFDSDGFTVPGTSGMTNGSGQTYLYIAFST